MKNKLGTPPVLGGFGEDVWELILSTSSAPAAVFDYNSEYYILLTASRKSPVKKHLPWYHELKLIDGRSILVRPPDIIHKIDPDKFAVFKELDYIIPYGKLTNESTNKLYTAIEHVMDNTNET